MFARILSGTLVRLIISCCMFLFLRESAAGDQAVLGLTPVGSQSCIAVEIGSPQGLGLVGIDWLHNDGSLAFPLLVLMEGVAGQPPDLADTALVLAEISGESLGWGSVSLPTAVSSSSGTIYAVFVLPNATELTGTGAGTGPGIGIAAAEAGSDPPDIYLSSDGIGWSRYDPSMQLSVVPRYGAGKVGAVSLESLKESVPPDLFDLTADTEKHDRVVPPVQRTVLYAATPNPFNPRTEIRFDLAAAGRVTLKIYNVRGRLVRALFSGRLPQGRHQRIWEGDDDQGARVASGAYFLVMDAGGEKYRKKLALVR